MGMNGLRKALLDHPKLAGDVLEVSAGTGRNFDYYPLNRMSSLTLTDTSKTMLKGLDHCKD
jgi:methyltransferase OMS1